MKNILILPDLIFLTLRRLRSRLPLTLLALLGVVLAIGLLSSTAFFSQAVDRVILLQELGALARTTGRQPFATRIYYLPSARRPLSLTQGETLAKDIGGALASEIGLPVRWQSLSVESNGLMLLPDENDQRYQQTKNEALAQVTLIYREAVGGQMAIVAGEGLLDAPVSPGGTLDVWMHTSLAEQMGIKPGETFRVAVNLSQAPRAIRVRGLWQAKAATDAFWFNNPDETMKSALLVRRDDYIRLVEPMLPAKAGFVAWQVTLDDQALNPAEASRYAGGFKKGMQIVNQFLPSAKLDLSALDPLEKFVRRQATLTLNLLSFNVPAFGFLLAFLVLIALIIAGWQRRETAILVSRGMSLPTVIGLTLLEECILYLIGVPLGIGFGMWLARMMGNTISFLTFRPRDQFPVSLQGLNLWLVVIALAAALLARLLPTFQAARQSVVTQEREQARPLRPPWWQRVYLDLLLLLPTYYAYQQLVQRGTLATKVANQPDQLFQDPLLILLPALVVLCASLLSMRLFTIFVRLLDFAAGWAAWPAFHLALRQLGRYGHGYTNALLLMIVSLALGIYTYSLAASLDQWLIDRVYYSVGADASFRPAERPGADSQASNSGGQTASPSANTDWVPTNTEFAQLDGVKKAVRVGRYKVRVDGSGEEELQGHFLGVDRAEFPTIAWFRADFAGESLGALMNRLALAEDNILVPASYLAQTHHQIGETISLAVTLAEGITIQSDFKIAGVYTYFPTADPEDAVTIVGNLEYLYLVAGATFPYSVWLSTDAARYDRLTPLVAEAQLFDDIQATGIVPAEPRDARGMIAAEQAKFERVGIFGTLSVGFLAATVMAALALLIYSYASLQDRLFQFGVLRAIGLYRRQVLSQVILEYSLLIAYGVLSGWWIGAVTSQLFAPFFRLTDVASIPLPPLIPVIPQDKITNLVLIFAAVMLLIEVSVIARALAGRLFSALRIGHQA